MEYLVTDLRRLLYMTDGCRGDMHEPDEQGLEAYVVGNELDNSYGTAITVDDGFQEIIVVLKRNGRQEKFNLCNLIALARNAKFEVEK